jgi:hypothetical protein
MTPPRGPAPGTVPPGAGYPTEWSLRQVQYDVGESGIASAFRRDDIHVAFVRRCRVIGGTSTVVEMSGRNDAIGPHLDRALALWNGMPFIAGLAGCDVLQLVYLRSYGASVIPGEKDVPKAPRSQHAALMPPNDARDRCGSCPDDVHLKVPTAGWTGLKGCVSDLGTVESGSILRSGGEDPDLVALWLFGIGTYRPLVVDGQPRGFCSMLKYQVVHPVL